MAAGPWISARRRDCNGSPSGWSAVWGSGGGCRPEDRGGVTGRGRGGAWWPVSTPEGSMVRRPESRCHIQPLMTRVQSIRSLKHHPLADALFVCCRIVTACSSGTGPSGGSATAADPQEPSGHLGVTPSISWVGSCLKYPAPVGSRPETLVKVHQGLGGEGRHRRRAGRSPADFRIPIPCTPQLLGELRDETSLPRQASPTRRSLRAAPVR